MGVRYRISPFTRARKPKLSGPAPSMLCSRYVLYTAASRPGSQVTYLQRCQKMGVRTDKLCVVSVIETDTLWLDT